MACQLAAHRLTVTQLAFSPSGRRLLSVSRDRSWAVFCRQEGEQEVLWCIVCNNVYIPYAIYLVQIISVGIFFR